MQKTTTAPTAETLIRSFQKAAAQRDQYEVTHIMDFSREAGGGARYRISHKVDFKNRNYAVEVDAIGNATCTCPEFERSHYCKHGAICLTEYQDSFPLGDEE